jgi:hypothetical protein
LQCQILVGLGIAFSAIPSVVPAVSVFLLHEIARGLYEPLKEAYLHDQIDDADRAAFSSLQSTGNNVGGLVGLGFSGLLANATSIPFTWVMVGGLLVVTATFFKRHNGSS